MTSRETLECRIYMAGGVMYRRRDELNRHLHELGSRLEDLTTAVHRVLRQRGQAALEVNAASIVQAVEAFESGIALSEIRAKAEKVISLKGLIDGYDRELAEGSELSGATWDDSLVLEILARV